MPDFDFSDGLSEDWVSQRGSTTSASASGRPSIAVLRSDSPAPSSSGLDGSVLQAPGSATPALAERSPSQVNARRRHPHDENAASPAGTVQRRASEAPDGGRWRKENWGRASKIPAPQDLFSSLRLEKMFRPPTLQAQSRVPRPSAGVLVARAREPEELPSSPPIRAPRSASGAPQPEGQGEPDAPARRERPHPAGLSSIREATEVVDINDGPANTSDGGSVLRSNRRPSTHEQPTGPPPRSTRVFSKSTNESFSAVDLNTLQASIKAAAKTFHTKRDSRGAAEQERPSSRLSDHGVDYGSDPHKQHRHVSRGSATEVAAPSPTEEDSSLHEAMKRTSGFVTLRRGGYSSDESFRRRPLSPSSFQQFSTPMLPQLPRQASRLSRVTERDEPPPTTPAAAAPQQGSPERPRSAGSPLKLFDQHDTFTKDHLTRRISQFQIGDSLASSDEIEVDGQPVDVPPEDDGFEGDWLDEDEELEAQAPTDSELAEGTLGNEGLGARPEISQDHERERRSSGFGNGALDTYSFTECHTTDRIRERVEQARQSPPSRRVSASNSRSRRASERRSRGSSSYHVLAVRSERQQRRSAHIRIGKRQQRSPQKDSEAKRQRTASTVLSTSDGIRVRSAGSQSPTIDSLAGRKRRDARYDDPCVPVDPQVLAARTKLRPKLPSGHSRSSSHTTVRLADQASHAQARSAATIRPVEPSHSSGVQPTASAAEGASAGNRKKSVTTADYFAEAQQVMQNIRQRALPLASFNRSQSSPNVQWTIEETVEPSSRPPTRDQPESCQSPSEGPNDTAVVHSQQHQDSDSFGPALESRFRAPRRHSDGSIGIDLLESDPPDMRIVEKPAPEEPAKQHDSQKSSSSGGQSTKSVPTRLSASSGTRTVIGPEKVSHLICENVGRMTFDPAKHRWVKRSASGRGLDPASSDPSEDDPLQEIPDLVVDEREEEMISSGRPVSNSSKEASQSERAVDESPSNAFNNSLPPAKDLESVDASFARLRPAILQSPVSMESHGPSDKTHVGQATAYTESPLKSVPEMPPTSPPEMPISYGRAIGSVAQKPSRLRSVMFSSPPDPPPDQSAQGTQTLQTQHQVSMSSRATQTQMSPVQTSATEEAFDEIVEREADLENVGSLIRVCPSREGREDAHGNADGDLAPSGGNMDVALTSNAVACTPPAKRADLLRLALNSSVAFHLSPLPSFTVHQADESLHLDLEYVARRRGLASAAEVDGRFTLAVEKLVATIKTIEPHDPFWEHLRALRMPDRDLLTLHMLDGFCPRVEALAVDGNELGQLSGAPAGLRTLSARDNCLSDLTAWGHLWNLQYLDVSGNQITSLKAFSPLVHLRELVARENRIESLEGVLELDGLLKLDVARNSMAGLNLEEANLRRLEELNCDGNAIEQISGLDQLVALQRLKLRENNVRQFPAGEAVPQSLKHLDLGRNYLEQLDLSGLAQLETLLLDENAVRTIHGLDDCPLLRLSWRSQRVDVPKDAAAVDYDQCSDVRALALSRNKIPRFAPRSPMWSISRLELAHCGIQVLGERLGAAVPNLRVLNLNHNAIRDLKPLVGITALEELYVAGNRITRLRKTTGLLRSLGPRLRAFDCRDNPLTLGFYAPLSHRRPPPDAEDAGDTESWDACDGQDVFRLPLGDEAADQAHLLTLDKSTAFRRRVYEILCHVAGPALRTLDGLPARRDRVQEEKVLLRWLVDLDVLQRPGEGALVETGPGEADIEARYGELEVHDPDSGIEIDGEM